MKYTLCLTADLFFNSQECVRGDFAALWKIFELHFYIPKFYFFFFQNLNSLKRKLKATIGTLKWFCFQNIISVTLQGRSYLFQGSEYS